MRGFNPTNFPFMTNVEDDAGSALPGGNVKRFIATVALNIGDAVILHTVAGEVTKNTTTGDHHKRVGIVVGGKATFGKVVSGSDAVGQPAAAIGEEVLVCVFGICWGVAEGTTVAVGDKLRPGLTTAGRLLDGTDTTEAVAGITGKIVGTALDTTGTTGTPIRVFVSLG